MQDAMAAALETRLSEAVNVVEAKLDAEIEKLSRLDEDDLEALRSRRLEQIKKQQRQKQEWVSQGHGKYEEIGEEKAFFEEGQRSTNVVCHFFRSTTFRCKIVDKHLALLAPRHLECRFIKLDVERAPFLTKRLNIRVLPTICIVKEGNTKDYIVGFDQLGGHDEFTTEMLEWRIAQCGVINYSGDLTQPPEQKNPKSGAGSILGGATAKSSKNIRAGDQYENTDDELDDL